MAIADSDGDILHYYHISPIGSVTAWLKSYANIPALGEGWVECNGQTLSDAESPFDGQVIPDLNGDNRFLRGSSTSGSTGGSETHTHTIGTATRASSPFNQLGTNTTTDAGSTLPTYYEVVWVMRIK